MVKALIGGWMAQPITVLLKEVCCMEEEFGCPKKMTAMKDSTKIIRNTGKGPTDGVMA
jgi:hypothetical protein